VIALPCFVYEDARRIIGRLKLTTEDHKGYGGNYLALAVYFCF
jgi:hypothetical protein